MNNIAILSNSHIINRIGGAEVQGHLIANALSQKGWNVYFLSSCAHEKIEYEGYTIIPMPRDKNELYTLLDSLKLQYIYQRGRKELTFTAGSYCKKRDIKFIFAISMDIDCFKNKFLFRQNDTIVDTIKNLIHYRKNSKVDKRSLDGIRYTKLVLSQTEYQKKLLFDNLGIRSQVFENVHNEPENLHIHRVEKPVVLWLANLKEWKQPEIYLNMVEEFADKDIIFNMAGRVHSDKYKSLIEHVQRINSNFNYLGEVSFDKSNELIGNSDLFINTSKGQEGFPNTFIQAWLRGVPTLTLQFDPDEMIQRNKIGVNANGNIESLKQNLIQLAENNELRDELGKNARKFSADKFSVEKKIETFISLLQ